MGAKYGDKDELSSIRKRVRRELMRRLSTAITECGATCYSFKSMTGYVMSLL
jgi:hypothetical protein